MTRRVSSRQLGRSLLAHRGTIARRETEHGIQLLLQELLLLLVELLLHVPLMCRPLLVSGLLCWLWRLLALRRLIRPFKVHFHLPL